MCTGVYVFVFLNACSKAKISFFLLLIFLFLCIEEETPLRGNGYKFHIKPVGGSRVTVKMSKISGQT